MTQANTQTQPQTKSYKGMPMEGIIATWYANSARDQNAFTALLKQLHTKLAPGSCILEVAPGPGYLSIALAKLGFKSRDSTSARPLSKSPPPKRTKQMCP